MNKSERAHFYIEFLSEEGFRPSLDSKGNIDFKVEGDPYHIVVSEKQEEYFELFRILGTINKDDMQRAFEAANLATEIATVAKVCVHCAADCDPWVTTSVEMFIMPPEGVKNVFRQALGAIRFAVEAFTNKFFEKTVDARPAA